MLLVLEIYVFPKLHGASLQSKGFYFAKQPILLSFYQLALAWCQSMPQLLNSGNINISNFSENSIYN